MSWVNSTIGDVLSVIQNGINCKQAKDGIGDKISRIETISDAIVNFNKVGYAVLSESEKHKAKLHKNDILFSHINSPIHVGKTALFAEEETLYHGINLLRLRVNGNVDSRFFNYFLNRLFWSGYWKKTAKQSVNQASVNQTDIKVVPFSYPPIPEQQRIVAILDQAFADIEKARANAERNLKNARELFDSYLNQVFSQRGEGWVETNLASIAENLDSRRVPITKSKRTKGEYPYYGASGIVDYVSDFIFDEDLLLISEDGANLLARTYPIAFSASGKYWVNNHAHVLRFKNGNQQKFIEYYLNSISLVPYISGMAQPKLNQKSLNNIPVPMADSVIVNEIVKKLNVLSNDIDELEVTYKNKLASLEELKKSLLQKAFSGELTKTEGHAA